MKGIILAGGKNTRLYPITISVVKSLLPVYNQPAIFYPLGTLLNLGIKDVLIISTEKGVVDIKNLFDKLKFTELTGVSLSYEVQKEAKGVPDAFLIGEKFIGNDSVTLVLGDNIILSEVGALDKPFVGKYTVDHPERFGVIEYFDDSNNKIKSIIEKPKNPPSKDIVVGLYSYDNRVVNIAKTLKPSNRGELEVTDINNQYISENNLLTTKISTWFDIGVHDILLNASIFIKNTGLWFNYNLFFIAFKLGYINEITLAEMLIKYHNVDKADFYKKLSEYYEKL